MEIPKPSVRRAVVQILQRSISERSRHSKRHRLEYDAGLRQARLAKWKFAIAAVNCEPREAVGCAGQECFQALASSIELSIWQLNVQIEITWRAWLKCLRWRPAL